ncbi:MAG: MBG domain-containing protein, partial [Coriobacteriales bacterium]|nr:MBG domain-containing protein [Coriobacteriales bacterium]
VGTYTATLTLGKGEGALSVSKDFSILPRMYVDATGTTCTYDGKAHGISVNVSVDGATVTYSESRDGKYSTKAPTFTDAGTHTVWYRVSKDGHPTKSGSADVVIKPKAVGISWSGTKLTYNAKNQGPTAKATGLVSGDKCTVTVSGAAKDAGTHTATATALSNANYKLPGKSTTKFAIAKAKLTVTAKDKTIKFGAKPANAGVTYSGLKGKDTAKSLGGKLTYKYTYKKGSKAGTYKIAPSGLKSKNYAITYNKGTLTVEAPSTVATRGAVRADGKDWVETGKNGVFGTTGESRRTTGIKIGLEQLPYSGGILYKGHFQDKGWQSSWTLGDSKCAVKNKRLEAVQIKLKGEMADHYNVYYRVHTQKLGWMAWAKDGERAGTTSASDRLEAVQVVVQKKGTKAPGKNYNKVKQTYPKAYTEKV